MPRIAVPPLRRIHIFPRQADISSQTVRKLCSQTVRKLVLVRVKLVEAHTVPARIRLRPHYPVCVRILVPYSFVVRTRDTVVIRFPKPARACMP
eukprot:scaffold594114_cov15-Prasinocladus_malaysianus.AAC.1